MNKLLDQFKYLNPQDPGTWPVLPKLLALLAVLGALVFAGYASSGPKQECCYWNQMMCFISYEKI